MTFPPKIRVINAATVVGLGDSGWITNSDGRIEGGKRKDELERKKVIVVVKKAIAKVIEGLKAAIRRRQWQWRFSLQFDTRVCTVVIVGGECHAATVRDGGQSFCGGTMI